MAMCVRVCVCARSALSVLPTVSGLNEMSILIEMNSSQSTDTRTAFHQYRISPAAYGADSKR